MQPSPHGGTSNRGVTHARADNAAPTGSGVHRNILVGPRRLRQRGVRREIHLRRYFARNRFPRCLARVRADGAHRRLRVRHHLRRPLQSRGHARRGAGQAGGVEGVARLLDHPGDRRAGGRHGDLRRGQGPGGLDRDGQHGRQRFRRPLSRRLLAVGGDRRRGRSSPVCSCWSSSAQPTTARQKASRACRSA